MQTRHVRIQIRFQRDTYEVFRFYFFYLKFMYLYVLTIMWLKKYFFLWNIWIMIIKWYFVSDCARKTSRLDRWMILRRLTNRLAFITEIPPSESSSANNHIYLPVEYAIGKPLDSGSTDAVINCISRKRRAIVNRYITRSLNRKLQSIRKVNSIYIAVGQEWVLRHIILNWPIFEMAWFNSLRALYRNSHLKMRSIDL